MQRCHTHDSDQVKIYNLFVWIGTDGTSSTKKKTSNALEQVRVAATMTEKRAVPTTLVKY